MNDSVIEARRSPVEPDRTIASEQRDFREWHLGRPRYAVWAIALDDEDVDARLAHLRRDLVGLLSSGYARQPHITVLVCGFPSLAPTLPDDFSRDQLQAHLDVLAGGVVRPFDVTVGEAFTFSAAACLSVQDPTLSLERLRTAWQSVAPTWDQTPYRPHVTAGFYSGAWPKAEVLARLAAGDLPHSIPLRIRHLDWMCYDSRRIAGPLHSLLRFDLERRQLHVIDESRFRAAFRSQPLPQEDQAT